MAGNELLREYSKERSRDRLREDESKPISKSPFQKYVKEGDYKLALNGLRRYVGELESELRVLKKWTKDLQLPPVIAMPSQRSLSIPVTIDQGGLGTDVRPRPGQVPVGQPNNSYYPASAGGIYYAITTTTSVAYTALTSDDIILADASGGAITITLPTAVGIGGKVYTIKRTNAGANNVTITGSQNIDSDASVVLTMQHASVDIISDGTQWRII